MEDGKAVCLHCKRSVSARNGNHPICFCTCMLTTRSSMNCLICQEEATTDNAAPTTKPGCSQLAIAESLSRSQKYEQNNKRCKQLTDFVTYCLAKPMLFVEKFGFKQVVAALHKRYDLPARRYFSRTVILALYNRTRCHVLQEINYYFATTDLWSSHGMKPFMIMSYTIHFITKEWELKVNCLQTLYFPDSVIS